MGTPRIRVGPRDHGSRMMLVDFAEAEAEPGHRYELARGIVQVVEVPGLPHNRIVAELSRQISVWATACPDVANYYGGGDVCVLRLPGMQSERHPDFSIYLSPPPDPVSPWDAWIPEVVAEVVSRSSRERDCADKRTEYLAAGVREYWIIDPDKRALLALRRRADIFDEHLAAHTYETPLLPGLSIDVARLLAAGG